MQIPVYIISGFLGAGKTTCIRHLLAQTAGKARVMIIENDFGEVSFDAQVLQSAGVQVQELTSGCICCTLAGDFKQSLQAALRGRDVDLILIEPSGVGKLSDIIAACQSAELADKLSLRQCVTVVDVQRCALYLRNFGEFYKDQISHSQVVFLSHVDENPQAVTAAEAAVRTYNPTCRIYAEPWEKLPLGDLVFSASAGIELSGSPVQEPPCDQDRAHDHAAPFVTCTLYAKEPRSAAAWQQVIRAGISLEGAALVRVKGILPTPSGYIQVQYNGGALTCADSTVPGRSLTCIGTSLQEKRWRALWEEV